MTEAVKNPPIKLSDEDLDLILDGADPDVVQNHLVNVSNEDLDLILVGGRANKIQSSVRETIQAISKEVSEGRARSSKYTTDNKLLWQDLQFGSVNPRDITESWSGYIGVDEDDLAQMVQILMPIAEHEAINKRGVNIRWLLGTVPEDNPEDIDGSVGIYDRLLPTDSRLIIDAENEETVKRILQSMGEDPRWHEIERKRLINSEGIDVMSLPHLPGTFTETRYGVAPQIIVVNSASASA